LRGNKKGNPQRGDPANASKHYFANEGLRGINPELKENIFPSRWTHGCGHGKAEKG